MSYALNMKKIKSNDIFALLVEFRQSRGFTQRDIARLIGKSQAYIADVERGDIKEPISYIKNIKRWLEPKELAEMKQALKAKIDEEIGD